MNDALSSGRFVADRLRANGYRALFAGGCVRDSLLGVEPDDYDVATDAPPSEVCRLFVSRVEVGAKFGVIVVNDGGSPVEVAAFRSDGRYVDGRHPESVSFGDELADALRRDFTINGMFIDPATDQVLDYVGGRADLEASLIRAIGDPEARFAEDRLRMMRAVRFAARLGFTIDAATAAAIKTHAAAIVGVSAERIRDELVKMITGPGTETALELMDRLGLLERVLPEITALKGVAQPPNYHPEGDVYIHTLLCMSKLSNPSVEVAMGTLLHDVAKGVTMEVTDRIRYPKHEVVGAQMAGAICERLRFSARQRERIVWLVARHMAFKDAARMRLSRLKRLLAAEGFDDLAALARADALASNGDLSDYEFCMEMRRRFSEEEVKPRPLVRGDDLIEMGLQPGPIFAVLLEAAYNAQLDGSLTSRSEAIAFVRELASRKRQL